MLDKKTVHQACLELIDRKIGDLQQALDDLFKGVESESKSSAGDKHETGRAMVQIEQARLGKQLSDLQVQRNVLRGLDPEQRSRQIEHGSLIETDQGNFYLSIALGKIMMESTVVMTLSPQSPLGHRWMGMRKGEHLVFNDTTYLINEVC